MGTRDKRVDAYIAHAAPFAQPILSALREYVHAACPDAEETMKWSRPAFDYQGSMCGLSAFKAHLSFGFWLAAEIKKDAALAPVIDQLDRLTSLAEVPAKREVVACIKRAMALNEAGVKLTRAVSTPKPVVVPGELAAAFKKNVAARKAFDAMSPSHRREYCEWIADAKRDETKATRVEKTIAQLRDGKALNWQYDTRQRTKASTRAKKGST